MDEKCPPATDPSWVEPAEALLAALHEPQDWSALKAWGKANKTKMGRLRQLLAWLSLYRKAHPVWVDGIFVGWVRSE